MAIDGRLLAKARDEKEAVRTRSMAEDQRRHTVAYARIPELRELDGRIGDLMLEVITAASGGEGRTIEEISAESLELQEKRAELLVEHGLPMDWLDGAWDCPKCRDTGYVEGRMCDCLKKLYEQQKARDLSALLRLGEENFSAFDLSYYDARPDAATGVSPRERMETVFGACRDYAVNFGENSDNLLFRGGTGLGKTFLSACIARVVSESGHSVVYDTAVSCLSCFESQKFARSALEAEEAGERVDRTLKCELLILDDLGTEMTTEFTKSALYTLVNNRLINSRKTIISTNLSSKDMWRRYTPQIMSRLEGEYQVLTFTGSDIRQIKKERGLA
jgi:DNA replication protein DnaC